MDGLPLVTSKRGGMGRVTSKILAKSNLSMLGGVAANIATILFILTTFQQLIPRFLRYRVSDWWDRVMGSLFDPYIEIKFSQYVMTSSNWKLSEAFTQIETYLISKSSEQAARLQGEKAKKSQALVISMDEFEEVYDEFQGIKIQWQYGKDVNSKKDETPYYKVTFHRRHRKTITKNYLTHVFEEGKAIELRNRQSFIFTNNSSESWWLNKKCPWSGVVFEHPATLDTFAMDPDRKQELINDLKKFKDGKDYYTEIGRAWKRGYLLYGPPGTGKSTLIAAMANFLGYDVYDIELTTVQDNSELKRLLINTTNKSIIVIEDIDCTLRITGDRSLRDDYDDNNDGRRSSKVTLSGLLNFIDGLWAAFGGQRIVVFTTNHVDKLDPALIRSGRMDKHIELSYCTFGAFKVLARNYLRIDSHHLFPTITDLLEQVNMTPADVAESLTPKSDEDDADRCLERLIRDLQDKTKADQKAKLNTEIEAKLTAINAEQYKGEDAEDKIKQESESDKEHNDQGDSESSLGSLVAIEDVDEAI